MVRFRLVHLLYVITLLAISLATFGLGGIAPGILISAYWGYIFAQRNRPQAFVQACVVVVIFCCIGSLLLPAVKSAREAAPRMACSNNLKQIVLALHNYHAQYGTFPPAYFTDNEGRPTHSWRVLLLPFLEQQGLYNLYRFDEPWNGPNNSKLLGSIPAIYMCPTAGNDSHRNKSCTSYVAIVGPKTVWPGASTRKMAEIPDGTPNTIMLLECSQPEIHWLEPRDLDLGAVLELVSGKTETSGGHRSVDFFYERYSGRNVAWVDGSIGFVAHGVHRSVWSAMLGIDDGITWSDGDLASSLDVPLERLRIGNCVRLGVFVFVSFFPLPWVWLPGTCRKTAVECRSPD